jgi:N,N'-diacetyllegionaminate synthase
MSFKIKRNHVLIIAEAGVNHNGSVELAKRLAEKAKEAGADIVKYQTANPNKIVTKSAGLARYQLENLGSDDNQYMMLKKLMFPYDVYSEIFAYCREIGIEPLSTPFDIDSIAYLDTLKMPFWKIPSGEITNYPYLVAIAQTHKPVVLSTGMSDMCEVMAATDLLIKNGTPKDGLIVLHCNTQYPTPYEDVNLRAMETMRRELSLPVGYSDHTQGISIPIAAVALGAVIIEKHFTLDRNMPGPDHKASLEPNEFKSMVRAIRQIECAMGNGVKEPQSSEVENINIVRKSIVANKAITTGEIFSEENITTKRPGTGVSPMKWMEIIGHRAKRDYREDEQIEEG